MFVSANYVRVLSCGLILCVTLATVSPAAASDEKLAAAEGTTAEHFQKNVAMGCASGECTGAVPLPKKGTVLINNLSCLVVAGSGSEIISADIAVRKAGSLTLTQYIGGVRGSSFGTHTLTQPMTVEVKEGRTAEITIAVSSSGDPLASCSITGTKTTE